MSSRLLSGCPGADELLARFDLAAVGATALGSSEVPGSPASQLVSGVPGKYWAVPLTDLADGVSVRVQLPAKHAIKLLALHWAHWPNPYEYSVSTWDRSDIQLLPWSRPAAQRELVPIPDVGLNNYIVRVRPQSGVSGSDGRLLVQTACYGRLGTPFDQLPSFLAEGFGVSTHLGYRDDDWFSSVKDVNAARAAGATWVRATARWDELCPSGPGTNPSVLAVLDAHVETAMQRGARICLVVHGTPRWAGVGRRCLPGADLPADPSQFADFIDLLARRYGTRVGAWEIWNEANVQNFLCGSAEEASATFASLYRVAHRRLHGVLDRPIVVLGGLARLDLAFLLRVLDADPGPVDAIAVHPYNDGRDPLEWFDEGNVERSCLFATSWSGLKFFRNVATVRGVLDAKGLGAVPLWLTEMGWDIRGHSVLSEAVQAEYAMRALRALWNDAPGITHAFWFSTNDWGRGSSTANGLADNMGLVGPDWQPRALARALPSFLAGLSHSEHRVASVAPGSDLPWWVYHGWVPAPTAWKVTDDAANVLPGLSVRAAPGGWLELRGAARPPCAIVRGLRRRGSR